MRRLGAKEMCIRDRVRIFPHALLRVGNAHAPQQLHGTGVLFLAGKPGVLEGFRYLQPGAVYPIHIRTTKFSKRFEKGSRLRVTVTSLSLIHI